MKKEELIKDKIYTAVIGGIVWIGHFDNIKDDIIFSLVCMRVDRLDIYEGNLTCKLPVGWMTHYESIRESTPEEINLLLSQLSRNHVLYSILNKSISYEIY